MKIKKIIKRYLRRILISLSVIFILSGSLIVNAEVTGDSYIYPFQVAGIQIYLMDSNGTPLIINTTADGNTVNSNRVRFTITQDNGANFLKNQSYTFLVAMYIRPDDESAFKYWNGDFCVSASYKMSISSSCAINVSQDNYAARSNQGYTQTTEDGKYTYNAYNVVTVNYPYSDIGDCYFGYENRFRFTPNTTSSHITFNLYQVDFSALTSSERDALLITENQDKNTDKIIESQKENAEAIIKAQKENTDKILYGDDFDGPSQSDKDIVSESNTAEENLLAAADNGFEWFRNTFTFSHDYFDDDVGNGMKVVSQVWIYISELPFFGKLILWSIMLGGFGFLANAGASAVRKFKGGKDN